MTAKVPLGWVVMVEHGGSNFPPELLTPTVYAVREKALERAARYVARRGNCEKPVVREIAALTPEARNDRP